MGWSEFLETVTYKENWTFEHEYDIDRDRDYLIVRMKVEDTYNPGVIVPVFTKREVPAFDVLMDGYAEYVVRELVHMMECHEADENLRFSGVMTFDPHREEASV